MIDTNPTISIITSNVNGQLKVRDCQRGLKKKTKTEKQDPTLTLFTRNSF